MIAGPIQCSPVLEDRQFVLPAVEKPAASLYRLVGVAYLGLDARGERHQRKQQECDKNSISHAPSFSLLIGEFD